MVNNCTDGRTPRVLVVFDQVNVHVMYAQLVCSLEKCVCKLEETRYNELCLELAIFRFLCGTMHRFSRSAVFRNSEVGRKNTASNKSFVHGILTKLNWIL